MSSRYFK